MEKDSKNSNAAEKKEGTAPKDRPVSPEQLDDYIRVTTPGMWIIVVAMLVLLTAGIIWAYAGRLELSVTKADGEVSTEYIAPAAFLSGGQNF